MGVCMRKLKLAMVGCGESANDFALVGKLIPKVLFVAACDSEFERAQTYAKRNRISAVFTDYVELLALDDIDAVCLATPHDLHYEMIIAAVQAGKQVFVEKPMTRTYEEAKKLIPQITSVKVGVNFQYRYDVGCYAMARASQSGKLGKVHAIRINVPWHRSKDYFENSVWHKTIARAGGGTLITQASHFLDIALWSLNEKPISAIGYAETRGFNVEVDTVTHGVVETEDGTLISITSSMVTSSEQPVTIEMYGDQGTAFYKEKPIPSVRFMDVRVKKEHPPVWGVHAYQRSLAGFAKWILDDKTFLVPAASTLPTLAAVDGIYRSAQSGKLESIEI